MFTRDELTTVLITARIVDGMTKPPDHPLCSQIPKLIARANEALNDLARVRHDFARDLRELTENDDVVGSAETAEMLRTSRRSVQRKARNGELDSEIVGGSLVFKRAAVEEYRRSNRHER